MDKIAEQLTSLTMQPTCHTNMCFFPLGLVMSTPISVMSASPPLALPASPPPIPTSAQPTLACLEPGRSASTHLRSYASAATAAVRPSPLAFATRPRLRATLAAAPLAPGRVLALFIWEDGVSAIHLGRAHPVVFVERAHLTLIRLLFYCPHKLLKGDKWKNGENLCSLMLGVYT